MSSISRTVLREQVKDVLLHRIVTGEIRPGERLVETRIAQELGTSQAPVREALRDLELLRLVESEPFKGTRVREFGDQEMVEVYPVRAALEEVAARAATKNLAGDVSALEAEVEAMRAAARRGDIQGLAEHDIAFHRLLVEAAGHGRPRPSAGSCSESRGGSRSRSTRPSSSPRTRPSSTARSSRRCDPRSPRRQVERRGSTSSTSPDWWAVAADPSR